MRGLRSACTSMRRFLLMLLGASLLAPCAARAAFPGTADTQPIAALAQHNCARRTVTPAAASPIADLGWSDALATVAQTWTDACHYGHSGIGYGESIYAAAGFTPTMKSAVSAWLSEQPYYDYASNTCSAPNPPGTCGHYTQAIWNTTTQVGCGITKCTQNSPFAGFTTWWFVTCEYSPPGNFGGRPY
jgi:pathogenesis-related protein 1